KISKNDYTIWGHKENGFADLLYRLNKAIWDYFERYDWETPLKVIMKRVNPKEEYRQKIEAALEKIGWKIPDFLRKDKYICIGTWDEHKWGKNIPRKSIYIVEGLIITRRLNITYWQSVGDYSDNIEGLSLMKFLDDLAPALFLGYIVLRVEGNGLHADWGVWK
ncbi:MAG: hypothetical protein Q6363_001735, partial [Candidatus Njordarchaeota archaeon]